MKILRDMALAALLLGLGVQAADAAQYFAPRYNLSSNGQLQPPLTVEFTKGQPKKISASLTGSAGGEKVLVLGWQVEDGVGLATFQKGCGVCPVQTGLPSGETGYPGIELWPQGHGPDPFE